MSTALVIGVSGQDGAYLAELLLAKGYAVHGSGRAGRADSLAVLGIADRVRLHALDPADARAVAALVDALDPDEVYNLSRQSSVGASFDHPIETLRSTSTATLALLEAQRHAARPFRLFSAGSAECFGDTGGERAHEATAMRPCSPYGVGKAAAFWHVATYRAAYGLHASTGILFNHESPLRPERFVTQKIVRGACRIAAGDPAPLQLGNIDIARDWGWAPEYVDAMWRMLQADEPGDYVLATGETRPLEAFIQAAFEAVGLDWRQHVELRPQLLRPTDVPTSLADPGKARERLGWQARTTLAGVARRMVEAEQRRLAAAPDTTEHHQP
jgi:GDPmannose 4,6-dehydratase